MRVGASERWEVELGLMVEDIQGSGLSCLCQPSAPIAHLGGGQELMVTASQLPGGFHQLGIKGGLFQTVRGR